MNTKMENKAVRALYEAPRTQEIQTASQQCLAVSGQLGDFGGNIIYEEPLN